MSHHPQVLVPREWTIRDRLMALAFPKRKATIPAASWVEELMAKRFGALIVCGSCASKYRDGLHRWAYVRHPDMKVRGNACDFCKQVEPYSTPLWFKEEHRYPTAAEHARQAATALAPWPSSFRGEMFPMRRSACTR